MFTDLQREKQEVMFLTVDLYKYWMPVEEGREEERG